MVSVLNLVISNSVAIDLKGLHDIQNGPAIEKGIQKLFTYKNPEYVQALKWGRWAGNISKNLYSWGYSEDNKSLYVSRGGIQKLTDYLGKLDILINIIDNTLTVFLASFDHSKTELRDDQKSALNDLLRHKDGCLVAFTSFGKSLTLLELIRKLRQPAVVIVHTTFLQEQWIKEATDPKTFNMLAEDIGGVGGVFKKRKYGKLNICLYHSLMNESHLDFFRDRIGTVIFDEGQKSPIEGVQRVVNNFPARYRFAASANIRRKDGKEFLTLDAFGPIRHIAVEKDGASKVLSDVSVVPTGYEDSLYVEDKNYAAMLTRMASDKERNILICKIVIARIRKGKLVLIFVERKEQAGYLMKMLSTFKGDMLLGPTSREQIEELACPGSVKDVLLNYDDETAYKRITALANKKELQFIIGTQKAEVGLSVRTIDVGIITTPTGNNTERFNQQKGRIERTYSEEQEKFFGHKKAVPELIVLKDRTKPSREACSKVKDLYGDRVHEIKRILKQNSNNVVIRRRQNEETVFE